MKDLAVHWGEPGMYLHVEVQGAGGMHEVPWELKDLGGGVVLGVSFCFEIELMILWNHDGN